MAIINVPYTAGIAPITIVEMWAAGLRTTAVWRSTDWNGQSGTFTEYTNNGGGARPSLVEGQESYVFTDSDGDAAHAYKVQHWSSAGKATDFGPVITVIDAAEVAMKAQAVRARYIHPDGYAGNWVEFNPRTIRLTASRLKAEQGNAPYVPGTDYTLEIALLFKDSSGDWKGINLTGVTEIDITLIPKTGTAFTRKLSVSGEITVMDQAVDHPEGTRGHFRVHFANTDSVAVGGYDIDCDVTFSGGKIVEQFYGKFESVN